VSNPILGYEAQLQAIRAEIDELRMMLASEEGRGFCRGRTFVGDGVKISRTVVCRRFAHDPLQQHWGYLDGYNRHEWTDTEYA